MAEIKFNRKLILVGHNSEKLTILRKKYDLFIFHQKIDQTIKKEATKVDNEKLR